MRSGLDCVYCYLKQAVSCMKFAGIDEDTQYRLIYELMDYVKTFDRMATPAENSSRIYIKLYELIGNDDPYREIKRQSNDLALELYPRLKSMLDSSKDRIYDSLKMSVAGNVIDLGPQRSFNVDDSLKHSLETGFAKDDYQRFLEKLSAADHILFLGDNAGEIVFDRILVEELNSMSKKVTYVVKEKPVLNDATMEDAIYTGIDKVANVITNGSSYIGTCLEHVSKEMIDLLYKSPLVIAKGQAQFESLEDMDIAKDRVFFLLKIKCEEIAKYINARFGDVVFFTR